MGTSIRPGYGELPRAGISRLGSLGVELDAAGRLLLLDALFEDDDDFAPVGTVDRIAEQLPVLLHKSGNPCLEEKDPMTGPGRQHCRFRDMFCEDSSQDSQVSDESDSAGESGPESHTRSEYTEEGVTREYQLGVELTTASIRVDYRLR
jgi:hypothetical protein